MNTPWTVRHDSTVKRFEIQFPGNTVPKDLPPYVRLVAGKQQCVLKTTTRRGASGQVLLVSSRTIKAVPDGTEVQFVEASSLRYHWHRLWHDTSKTAGLVGLLLTVIGLVIDASLAIGKVKPLIAVSETAIVWIMWLSLLIKLIGIVLVFLYKDLLKED
jgi:hypothetical protein